MPGATNTSNEAAREDDELEEFPDSTDVDNSKTNSPDSSFVEDSFDFSDSAESRVASDWIQSRSSEETREKAEFPEKAAFVDEFSIEQDEGVMNKDTKVTNFEDFANFPSFSRALPIPNSIGTAWADFRSSIVVSDSAFEENQTETPFEDDDFGDFFSVSSAAPASNNNDPHSVAQSSVAAQPVVNRNNDCLDMKRIMEMIDLWNVGSDQRKDEEAGETDDLGLDFSLFDAGDLEKTSLSQEPKQRILSLWASVRDVVEAKALEHEWQTSVLNKNYLTSLEIEDNRLKGWNKSLEAPEQERKRMEMSKDELESRATFAENSEKENWSDEVSAAAAKILSRLPRISFLRTKKISFPN